MPNTPTLLIDLRPPDLRHAQPLPAHLNSRAIGLDEIEAGTHGLTAADGPLLVVCERGIRSSLAARFLRADGLEAEHLAGGVGALLGGQLPTNS